MACKKCKCKKEIRKRMNDINTFHAWDNEVTFGGTDEMGADFIITFESNDFLHWVGLEELQCIKRDVIKNLPNFEKELEYLKNREKDAELENQLNNLN